MSEQNKPVVKKSNILELLEQGKTRKQISEHYDLTMGDVRKIFQHPDLKGRKPKSAPGFIFEDDIANTEPQPKSESLLDIKSDDEPTGEDKWEKNVEDFRDNM